MRIFQKIKKQFGYNGFYDFMIQIMVGVVFIICFKNLIAPLIVLFMINLVHTLGLPISGLP